MPNRLPSRCTTPGCRRLAPINGRCDVCRERRRAVTEARRGTAADRGYGAEWAHTIRLGYLRTHPWCRLCGQAATIPDHWPISRRALVAARVADPDASHRLRPLCEPCHKVETARHQPGGWHAQLRE